MADDETVERLTSSDSNALCRANRFLVRDPFDYRPNKRPHVGFPTRFAQVKRTVSRYEIKTVQLKIRVGCLIRKTFSFVSDTNDKHGKHGGRLFRKTYDITCVISKTIIFRILPFGFIFIIVPPSTGDADPGPNRSTDRQVTSV